MSRVADYARLSDDELLRRTAEDREAFGAFYDRHVRAVLIELRRHGLPPDEAPARAWLLGIARNKLAHRHRGAAVETAARRKLGMVRLTYSDEALERVDELLDAGRSVYTNGTADLPPAEREAVVARVIEERDYDEIAAASGAAPHRGDRGSDSAPARRHRRHRRPRQEDPPACRRWTGCSRSRSLRATDRLPGPLPSRSRCRRETTTRTSWRPWRGTARYASRQPTSGGAGGSARGGFGGCPPLADVNRRVERRGAAWFGSTHGLDQRTYQLIVGADVESIRALAKGDWSFRMTPPWTPHAHDARTLRLVVAIDEQDLPEQDLANMQVRFPKLELSYANDNKRVARFPQAK